MAFTNPERATVRTFIMDEDQSDHAYDTHGLVMKYRKSEGQGGIPMEAFVDYLFRSFRETEYFVKKVLRYHQEDLKKKEAKANLEEFLESLKENGDD